MRQEHATPPIARGPVTDRRLFLHASLAAGLGALGAARSLKAAETPLAAPIPALGSAGPSQKKVLFVFGGWQGHEPVQCRDIFVPWMLSLGWDVTVSDTLDSYADARLLGSLDLIVQTWTMDKIGRANLEGLLAAVKGGVGLAGWHGGLGDAFRQETEYQFMVGGQWVAHPGNIIDYTVQIVDPEDPITHGLSDFAVKSEQYYMHVDPNNTVLATTRFGAEHAPWIDGATMPITWKRVYGKGRVFYTSLGHTADVFKVKEALTMMQRGILWASDSRHAPTPDLVNPVYPSR
jgi:uncharacterized protein